MSQIHKCGACTGEFASEDKYLAHKCRETGFKPTQIEHQDVLTDGMASKIAAKALERGAERKGSAE